MPRARPRRGRQPAHMRASSDLVTVGARRVCSQIFCEPLTREGTPGNRLASAIPFPNGRGAVRGWIVLGLAVSVLAGWAASSASARTLHYLLTVTVTGPGRVTGTGDGGSIDCPN